MNGIAGKHRLIWLVIPVAIVMIVGFVSGSPAWVAVIGFLLLTKLLCIGIAVALIGFTSSK